MHTSVTKIFYASLVIILLTSCFENPVCAPQGSNFVQIKFYDGDLGKEEVLDFFAITTELLPTLTMVDPLDTLSTSQLSLPLNPYEIETEFTFTFENSFETLRLGYSTKIDVLQNECGFDPMFEGLTLINSSFDSVVVVNQIINEQIEVNVKVYN